MPQLTDYTPDHHNANLGTDRGRQELAKSVKQLGLGRSILTDKDGRIIAGNKTYEAAVQEGVSKVVEVETEGDTLVVVKRKDLDLNEHIKARVLAHADNKIGQDNLNFDPAIVKADLELLQSDFLDELWTPDDLGELFDTEVLNPQITEDEPPIDKASELQAKWQVSPGDLWVIGEHRLICGDCTDKAVWQRLLGERKANVVFTSPPYAMQRKDQYGGVETDKYVAWFEGVQSAVKSHLANDGSFFVNIKPHCENGERVLYVMDLVLAMKRQWGWRYVDELCWVRSSMPGGWQNRFKNHFEPIHQFSIQDEIKFRPDNVRLDKFDSRELERWKDRDNRDDDRRFKKGYKSDNGSNFGAMLYVDELDFTNPRPSNVLNTHSNQDKLGHSAAFPVSLPTFFIKAYSDPNNIILDPFMGSGTTMVAAHNEKRLGYGIERLEKYCAVILERLSKLGLIPVKQ